LREETALGSSLDQVPKEKAPSINTAAKNLESSATSIGAVEIGIVPFSNHRQIPRYKPLNRMKWTFRIGS
jgi:hypothetical protein